MKGKTYITFININYSLILIGMCISSQIMGQIHLNNPSFEDTPSDATTPMGWFECQEYTTPDIMPGYWGVYNEAAEGETFVGMITRDNGTYESIGQRTSKTMKQGICHTFRIDLSHSKSYSGFNKPIKLRIWVGDKKCGTHQLVFESPFIEKIDWETFKVEFLPEKDARYILLEAFYKEGWFKRKGNILIDNMSAIRVCSRV